MIFTVQRILKTALQTARFAAPLLVVAVLTDTGFGQAQVVQQQQPRIAGPSQGPMQPGVQQAPPTPAPPFQLTPQQEAELDAVLQAWERRSNGIQTFDCKFTRWEYDSVFGPQGQGGDQQHTTESTGELRYAQPDKGLFHVQQMKIWNSGKSQYEVAEHEESEKWICDGKSIFEFDPTKKLVKEYRLPPEMQGKAIANGPLPFLFGAKAAQLKQRYYMRLLAPPDPQAQILIEAYPKYQSDAANFQNASIILSQKDFLPYALQILDPGGKKRTAYQFYEVAENKKGFFERDFSIPRIPFGWKKVVEQPPGVAASAPNGAAPVQEQSSTDDKFKIPGFFRK